MNAAETRTEGYLALLTNIAMCRAADIAKLADFKIGLPLGLCSEGSISYAKALVNDASDLLEEVVSEYRDGKSLDAYMAEHWRHLLLSLEVDDYEEEELWAKYTARRLLAEVA